MKFPSKEIVERLRREFPKGTVVELVHMNDELSRIRDNTTIKLRKKFLEVLLVEFPKIKYIIFGFA